MDSDDFLLFYKKIFYPHFPYQWHITHNTACYSIRPENVDEHSFSGILHFFFWTSPKDADYLSYGEQLSHFVVILFLHVCLPSAL